MEILLIIALTLTLLVLKKIFRLAFLSAPSIMALMWFFFIYASLALFPRYLWHYHGLIWILTGIIFFTIAYGVGEVFADKKQAKDINVRRSNIINMTILRKALVVSIVLGLSYGVLKLQSFGFSLGELFDFNKLGEINNSVAITRYTDGGVYSIFYQFLLSFVYLAPLLGGLLFSFAEHKKDKIMAFFAFVPELLAFSFSNEKATLLVCIFLWFSSYIVLHVRRYGKYPLVKAKYAARGVILSGALLIILAMSMMLRLGAINVDNFAIVTQKISNSYALSHVPAFDYYFSQSNIQQMTYGVFTFYGVANFAGIADREQGIYEDAFSFGNIGTNVFTAFRGLIQDFGLVGSLVFFVIIGLVAGISTGFTKNAKKLPYISITLLIAIYTFILYSFIVSVFSYLSIIAALIFFVIILALSSMGSSGRKANI